MSERESWEKELEALGRDSAAEGAEPVETAAGETETGAEQGWKKPSTGASVIFVEKPLLGPPLSAWWCF